jgi:nucleotide-binding universal stress UspA family protein
MGAAQQRAAVHLVHVHTPNDTISIEGLPVLDEQLHSLGSQHEHVYLDRIAQRLRADAALDVTITVLSHPVAPALLRYAADNHIELLVLTSHGHGGFAPAWLGSVADTLVRNSHLPVLLVRPTDGAAQPPSMERVLVPLDGSATGEQVLPFALTLGQPARASYTLLHVINPSARARSELQIDLPEDADDAAEIEVQRVRAAERYLHTVAERLRADQAKVETRIVIERQAAAAILDEAQDGQDSVIALATHGRGGVARLLLGSVADKVVRGAQVPVLVYRPQEEQA